MVSVQPSPRPALRSPRPPAPTGEGVAPTRDGPRLSCRPAVRPRRPEPGFERRRSSGWRRAAGEHAAGSARRGLRVVLGPEGHVPFLRRVTRGSAYVGSSAGVVDTIPGNPPLVAQQVRTAGPARAGRTSGIPVSSGGRRPSLPRALRALVLRALTWPLFASAGLRLPRARRGLSPAGVARGACRSRTSVAAGCGYFCSRFRFRFSFLFPLWLRRPCLGQGLRVSVAGHVPVADPRVPRRCRRRGARRGHLLASWPRERLPAGAADRVCRASARSPACAVRNRTRLCSARLLCWCSAALLQSLVFEALSLASLGISSTLECFHFPVIPEGWRVGCRIPGGQVFGISLEDWVLPARPARFLLRRSRRCPWCVPAGHVPFL